MNYEVGGFIRRMRHTLFTALAIFLFTSPSFALVRDPSIKMEWFRVFAKTGTNNEGRNFLTDITVDSNTVFEIELEIMNFAHSSKIFFARGQSATDRAYSFAHVSGKWEFYYGSKKYSAPGAVAGKRHTVRLGPDGFTVDGVTVAEVEPASFTSPGFLRLFSEHTYNEATGAYTGSNWGCANAKFYAFRIYKPGADGALALAHEIRACRTTAGYNTVYDAVTGSVYEDGSVWNRDHYPIGGPYLVSSDGATGDAVALTNAIACACALSTATPNREVRLDPGVYSLEGVVMLSGSHLNLNGSSILLTGTGSDPSKTILLGGAANDNCRVIRLTATGHVISNLTVTGGYVAENSDGGGIMSTAADYGSVVDCIVSNNYAKGSNGNGGGGIWGAKTVRKCLIAGNSAYSNGGGVRSCTTVEDCEITANTATGSGGGISGCKTVRCRIAGNVSKYHGGGQHAGTAVDCFFKDNVCHNGGDYGSGGGLYSGTATNSTFVGNRENDALAGYGSAAASSVLWDCTVTNSTARRSLFDACTLRRCLISGCGARTSDGTYPFYVFGRYSGSAVYTNVNCIIENISLSNAADRVGVQCCLLNCTVRNVSGKTNGPLAASCTAVNTIITGCTPYDLVAGTSASRLVNCVYSTSSGTFAEGQLVNCRQAPSLRFNRADGALSCDPTASSAAFNAALEADWILQLAGEIDCAGRPRRMFGSLDIGAMECQDDYVPGLRFILR